MTKPIARSASLEEEQNKLQPDKGTSMVTVLVVGQTPPPINGQTLMIQSFLEGRYERMRLIYVPMRFSRLSGEIGRFSVRKLLLVFSTLAQIIIARFQTGARVLYYPPADPSLVPVLRDMALLIPTRWLFEKTAFHFHAAGLGEIYDRLPRLLKLFFHLAYDKPDLAIFTTRATSGEGLRLRAGRTAIIPCGIVDCAPALPSDKVSTQQPPTILFAGILCEGKGLLNLLGACRILKNAGVEFQLVCLGQSSSVEFTQALEHFLDESGLRDRVSFPGVVTGPAKHRFFADATVFCFPSHYPAESFGVVLIEAMSFSLPIVATDWRGIPEVLGRQSDDTKCGLESGILVPVRDSARLASALQQILASNQDRERIGRHNRSRYLENYTIERYRKSLEEELTRLMQNTLPECSQQTTSRKRPFISNEESKKVSSLSPLSGD